VKNSKYQEEECNNFLLLLDPGLPNPMAKVKVLKAWPVQQCKIVYLAKVKKEGAKSSS